MRSEKYHDRIFYGKWMLNLRLTTVERRFSESLLSEMPINQITANKEFVC
jgi:hypothetical protein